MKPIRSRALLRLHRETLRRLGADELDAVNAASGLYLCGTVVPPPIVVPNEPIPGAGPGGVDTKIQTGCFLRCGTVPLP
jgi:hypothetical protein